MLPAIVPHPEHPEALRLAQSLGLHPVAARVLANRAGRVGMDPAWLVDLAPARLDPPDTLPDLPLAVARILAALDRNEHIALATDADSDGVNAHVVLTRALVEHFGHPAERVQHYIGLKLSEGYGVSDAVVDRILAAEPRPTLVITADIGSSDGPRIRRLANEGIDVIVTDHHGIPADGGPREAFAFINPQRANCAYPDPLIAGVMVAWLTMWAVRTRLLERDPERKIPSLGRLLGWVAVGTVADVVSLARSRNNRIVVQAGLPQIERGDFPCWQALRPHLGDLNKPLTSADIAFGIGPRINSAGRLHDAMSGVHFLMSETLEEAEPGAKMLNETNDQRRAIEKRMTADAMAIAETQVEAGHRALVVRIPGGHPGVQGIVASRLMQAYARPAICLSDDASDPERLTASGRSIDDVHLLRILQAIDARHPGLLIKFGGHAAAAGLTVREDQLDAFGALFRKAVASEVGARELRPILTVDAEVEPGDINLALIEGLDAIGPYGREFAEPILRGRFHVLFAKEVGIDGGHWRLRLQHGEHAVDAIWFNAGRICPLALNTETDLVFTPDTNWWKGECKVQIRIHACADNAHETLENSDARCSSPVTQSA